jgi:hypothetical protein
MGHHWLFLNPSAPLIAFIPVIATAIAIIVVVRAIIPQVLLSHKSLAFTQSSHDVS